MTPESLLDQYQRLGWVSEPFDAMLALVAKNPSNATLLLKTALDRRLEAATFLDDAVSYAPEDELAELTRVALAAYARDGSELACSVISHLSLQAVETFTPHLAGLSHDKIPNERSYDADWPWRAASDEEIERELERLSTATSTKALVRSFGRILQTRNPRHLARACSTATKRELPHKAGVYLREVGFDTPDRRLYTDTVFHLRFPPEYKALSPDAAFSHLRPHHPTWHLPTLPDQHRFGGHVDTGCAVCGGHLHNLLTLDPVPPSIAPGTHRIEVVTCLSCLGWSTSSMFFTHDADGNARPMPAEPHTPEFPSSALVETRVQLCVTPKRWQWQAWGSSNSRQNLHRLGGHPTWIQSAEYPTCPRCDTAMISLLQLDSNLPTETGEEHLWGTGGICYVFWCPPCRVSASRWQCT